MQIACAFSEKDDKRIEKGRLRTALRNAIAAEDWDRASYDVRDDVWNWAKDGKWWIGGMKNVPWYDYDKVMRK